MSIHWLVVNTMVSSSYFEGAGFPEFLIRGSNDGVRIISPIGIIGTRRSQAAEASSKGCRILFSLGWGHYVTVGAENRPGETSQQTARQPPKQHHGPLYRNFLAQHVDGTAKLTLVPSSFQTLIIVQRGECKFMIRLTVLRCDEIPMGSIGSCWSMPLVVSLDLQKWPVKFPNQLATPDWVQDGDIRIEYESMMHICFHWWWLRWNRGIQLRVMVGASTNFWTWTVVHTFSWGGQDYSSIPSSQSRFYGWLRFWDLGLRCESSWNTWWSVSNHYEPFSAKINHTHQGCAQPCGEARVTGWWWPTGLLAQARHHVTTRGLLMFQAEGFGLRVESCGCPV